MELFMRALGMAGRRVCYFEPTLEMIEEMTVEAILNWASRSVTPNR